MKRLTLRNKIVSFFTLFVFLFSQFAPISASAFDINQAINNILTTTKWISDSIGTIGGGVVKAGIATALNSFAQQLASNTVDSLATGGKGQQPLFVQFSLEDMLKQAIDASTGDFLDKISEQLDYNVCKPLNADDISWRLKLTLNIIPETYTNEVKLPSCTISKFIESVDKSIKNVSSALRKTFMADCFDEFVPNATEAANDPEGLNLSAGASAFGKSLSTLATNFSYDNLKSSYLYNVDSLGAADARASYFTKKATYYKQKDVNPNCISYKATTDSCDQYAQVPSVDANGQPILDADGKQVMKNGDCISFSTKQGSYFCKTSEEKDANKTSKCQVNNIIEQDCVSYNLPEKDGITQKYKPDTARQKRFLTQYKSCYLKKMNDAFNGLIELGQIPQDKINKQALKTGCTDLVGSILDVNNDKNIYSYFKAFNVKDKNIKNMSADDYKKVMVAAITAPKVNSFLSSTASGEQFYNYVNSHIDFFGDFEQAIVNCPPSAVSSSGISASECTNTQDLKEDGFINSDDFSIVFGDTNTYTTQIFRLMPPETVNTSIITQLVFDTYPNPKTLSYADDLGSVLSIPLTDDGKNLRTSSDIETVKTKMIDFCVKNADARYNLLAIGENEKTKQYLLDQKEAKAKAAAEAEANIRTTTAPSEYKAKEATISDQIKSMASMIENTVNTSTTASSNLLQPTGDLFIDPIQIFAATLLKEGSKKLMEGMFKVLFPTDSVDADLAGLDGITDVNDVAVGEDTVCASPGPVKKGEVCGNNGQCYSCYCELRQNSFENSTATAKNNFMTCQDSPSSSVIK